MAETTVALQGVTPYLTVRGARQASEWYARAFGAQEQMRVEHPDGELLIHCHLRVNGADLMMADEFKECGEPLGYGPRGVMLHLAVDDADAWWDRAVEAGATVVTPLDEQFWGDRYGQLRDPFGHTWSIGAPKKD